MGHKSDCALHNAPALPIGPCDCGYDALLERLLDAARKWRASLYESGWTGEDVRAVGRAGMEGVMNALHEIDGK